MNGRNIAIVVVLNLILLVIVIAQLDFLTISAASLFDLMNPLRPLTLVLFGLVFVAIFGAYKNGLNGEKLTRQKYETSRSMLDNLPVGVYRSTAQGRIVEANRRFSQLLGFETLSEMKQVNISDLYVRKSDRESHLAKLREGTVFAEFELRRKDGQTVWVRDYPKPTLGADGNVEYLDGVIMETYGTEAIVRDIAEHRRLESMRNQFATSVTHELRTPLVSINGYLDYVLSEDPGASLKDLRPDLEIVKHNADRLLELTNDLLDIQRMESGRLQLKLETVSFRDLLKHCIEEIQPMLEQKNQHLHLEIPTKHMPIRADQLRLSQALVNLLNNAVKFTPHGGNITIHVEEDDGEIQVAVHDTGIGIDRKDLDRVFEPFAAIVKPSYYKGTGLGLSLTKRLIEAHEGRIWANSPGKDRGATFTFILPKKRMVVEVHG